jgi:hypothetical protein
MKTVLALGAAALIVAALTPEVASARAGGFHGGGGFRGGGFGVGGFRGGGGFRAAAVGGGFRGGIGGFRGGFRGPVVGSGLGVAGFRGGFRGPVVGSGVRVAGFRGGWGGRGWGWRRGLGWPLAAGLAVGSVGYYGYPYYSSYYSDPCVAWNGYTWVDACY